MRIIYGLFWGLLLCFNVYSIEPVNPDLIPEGREVLSYLDSIYGQKTIAGYNVYVHTPDVYEQTARHGAIWGRDIRWLGDPEKWVDEIAEKRYILTLHWHWFYNDESAWTSKRDNDVDISQLVTEGTPEYNQVIEELDSAAAKLRVFADADIPVLWRPLHEIDGGWFWWTDKDNPENTASLWRLMYDYFTDSLELNNLIWVYSAGEGKSKTVEYRKGFYPGSSYVDISGIDIYHVDYDGDEDIDTYNAYWDTMSQVSPGKMLAMGECDAIPDPDKMDDGTLPKWLYSMPWWGCPSGNRPAEWAMFTMNHDAVVTLDELPAFGSGNISPHPGIISPVDDGSAWITGKEMVINSYAVDRDDGVDHVSFYANGERVGELTSPPWTYTWSDAEPGVYDLKTCAVDMSGDSTWSNNIRAAYLMRDLAKNKTVTASSGDDAEEAVNGDYFSGWSSDKSDSEWVYVDLGDVYSIDRVNLLWGWKIHAEEFSIQTALENPQDSGSWTTVYADSNMDYVTWEATYRTVFDTVEARYVRMNAYDRASNQDWGGYHLNAFEVPVYDEVLGNHSQGHVNGENELNSSGMEYTLSGKGGIYEINYSLGSEKRIDLAVYDLKGKLVKEVKNKRAVGEHSVALDLSELAAGRYILKISAGELKAGRSILIME